jgi:hypothetical protein
MWQNERQNKPPSNLKQSMCSFLTYLPEMIRNHTSLIQNKHKILYLRNNLNEVSIYQQGRISEYQLCIDVSVGLGSVPYSSAYVHQPLPYMILLQIHVDLIN